MDTGSVGAGSSVGFNLFNSNGVDRFTFEFLGGAANYDLDLGDGTKVDSGVPFTRNGLELSLTLGANNAFTLWIVIMQGPTTTLNGSLLGSDIDRVQLVNHNAGSGSASDLFFNDMSVSTAVPEPSTSSLFGSATMLGASYFARRRRQRD